MGTLGVQIRLPPSALRALVLPLLCVPQAEHLRVDAGHQAASPMLDKVPPSLRRSSAFSARPLYMLGPRHFSVHPMPQWGWPRRPRPLQASCGAQTHPCLQGHSDWPPFFLSEVQLPSCPCLQPPSCPMSGTEPSGGRQAQQSVAEAPVPPDLWLPHKETPPHPGALPCHSHMETWTPSSAEALTDRCTCPGETLTSGRDAWPCPLLQPHAGS